MDIGSIKVRMKDGVVKTLSNVYHISELKKNLVLMSALDARAFI